ALDLRLVELEVVVLDAALVEAVERQLLARRRPPHRRGLPQLFAVDPARGPVLHPRLLVAVGRDGELVAPVRVADPEVAVAVERPEPVVRRLRRLVLPAALRPAAPAQRRTLRRSPRRGRPARRDVVTVVRALPHVLEGATVLGPRHVQRTRLHRPGD